MNIIQKWNEIVNWQKSNLKVDTEINEVLNAPITQEDINTIEGFIGEKLPEIFKTFYLNGNGQPENYPLFFGLKFLDSKDIIRQLEYAESLIKPEKQIVNDHEKSQVLLEKIVQFYASHTPKDKLFGLKKKWYKIEFAVSLNSFEGPYLYKNKESTDREREILEISDYSPIEDIIKELHEIDLNSDKWDQMEFVLYFDGKFDVKRSNYNFKIPFTSTPKGAIKKKYFNNKWIPIFSDYGGNFIGIDLDPDKKGKKGQIINFGRDEEKMFVMADNLEHFFDFILSELNKNDGQAFKTNNHFTDVLRKLIK